MTSATLAEGMTVQSDREGHYAFCIRCQWESARYGYTVARRVARQSCPVCEMMEKPVADDREIDKKRIENELKKDKDRAEQDRPKPKKEN